MRSSGVDDVHDEYEDQCYLRYDNFIALNTFMIQSALEEIDQLKKKIQDLSAKNESDNVQNT